MGGTTSSVRNSASHRLQANGLVKPQPVGAPFPACRQRVGQGGRAAKGCRAPQACRSQQLQAACRASGADARRLQVLLPCLHKDAQAAFVVGVSKLYA